MKLHLIFAALLLHHANSEEQSWSWGSDQKNTADESTDNSKTKPMLNEDETMGRSNYFYDEEVIASPSDVVEDIDANSTIAGQIIDKIISSTREGRALDGFDEVYSDPNVQEALQKGDDGEARNIIKDRLCAIGLMQCDNVEEKRPYISPEELIYAQPVAINAVGKPIPTIPVKGVRGIGYGPPRPLPYPSTRPIPPGKFPPTSNKFPYANPNNPLPPPNGPNYFNQGKPPRRQFGVSNRPFNEKPNLYGEVYQGGEYFGKPPGFNEFNPPIEPEIPPYKFIQSGNPFGQKDKGVKITVNAQGGTTTTAGITPGTVEHVHHHYHHNAEGINKPVVINPIPIASAAVSTQDLSSNSFNGLNGFKPSLSVSNSAGLGHFGSDNAFQSNTYGGQTVANYGIKPVAEGFPGRPSDSFGASVGLYGSSGLYKKELNLNSGNNNYIQGGYADKYQGLQSSGSENYDCVCVPYDQCPSQDVIGRKDDLYLPLDPRNLKTDIEALTEEEKNNSDINETISKVEQSNNNSTNVESKNISKREAPVDAPVKDEGKAEARQRQYGSFGNVDMKKIKPTFGISFGLPQQGGGGYPLNFNGPSPLNNPYGGAVGAPGINLGLVSVNPLVSVQVSKDDYGNKEIKPFINLHVTPNSYLIHKFEDIFAHKKAIFYNKHKHYHLYNDQYPHYHDYYSHYHPNSYPFDVYREHPAEFEHRPPYSGLNNYEHYPLYDNYDHQNEYHGHHFESPPNYYPYRSRSYQNYTNDGKDNFPQYQNQYDQEYKKVDLNIRSDLLNKNRFNRGRELKFEESPRVTNSIKFPTNRKKRDINNKSNNLQKRQYYGGPNGLTGRPQTCGPRHVCCKQPVRPQIPNVNRQCGTRHSQGINGRIKNPVYVDGDSEFGEYPWQVAILKKDTKESVYVCGGTLIDQLHILTAAHCVKTYTGFDLRARLGEWDVNHDVEFYPYIEREIVSVHVHPEFYAGTLYNDIAILRMDIPVDWNKYPHISPACLPHPHDDYTGARCWTTGWGKDAFGDFGKYQNILKEVDVPIVRHDVCQRQLQNTRLGYDFKLHPGFVCAGGEEGKDACKGDGGGPMVCERGGTWQVVGLVSWGIGCGQTGLPGVYVKVSHYIDWIRQITQRF